MLIENLIRRRGGTHVTLGSTGYHFTPRKPNGPHVADVNDKAHVQRFLSIAEGYAICEDDEVQSTAPVAPADNLAGPVVHELDRTALDNMSHMEAPAAPTDAEQTGTDAQAPVDETQNQSQSAPASTDPAPAEQKAGEEGTEDENAVTDAYIDGLSEDELRVLYEKKNGRAAPANTRPDTLRDRVKELIAAE